MTDLSFTVLGKAAPAGSKRAFKHPSTGRVMVVDANRNAAPWKQQVAGTARDYYDGPLLDGPLRLAVTFFSPRPKSHYGQGRNRNTVKPAAPDYPTGRPDCTKLLRGVEDALTGVVWKDDAQIVAQHAFKLYGEPERTLIRIQTMPPLDTQEPALGVAA